MAYNWGKMIEYEYTPLTTVEEYFLFGAYQELLRD